MYCEEKEEPKCLEYKEPETNTTWDWDEIKEAIINCEVDSVFQSHSLDVSIQLKNGQMISWVEPSIDNILTLAQESKAICGDINDGYWINISLFV
jgi:hypothetical protein